MDPASPVTCTPDCRYRSSFCGDGLISVGEACDMGPRNADAPGAGCRTDCTLARCGDGVVDAPYESCDDRNGLSGDGCSPSCRPERLAAETFTLPASLYELPIQQSLWKGATYPLNWGSPFAPLPPTHAPVGDTGPGAVAVMAAGAAGGWAWLRRRRPSQGGVRFSSLKSPVHRARG